MTCWRILVLVHSDLVPPDQLKGQNKETAPYRTEYDVVHNLRLIGHEVKVVGVSNDLKVIAENIDRWKPQLVFNLLEEFAGEAVFDQNIVSYLELKKIPYTGCNPRGMILARDKALTKKILAFHGIKIPPFAVAARSKKFKRPKGLQFPLFVKSQTEEGSLGIAQESIVYDETKLKERLEFIHGKTHSDAIVESYIPGREFYVGVLGHQRLQVLPIIELVFKKMPGGIHRIATSQVKWNPDYRKKYGIEYLEPKNLSQDLVEEIQKISKKTYKALGLSGYARLDLRLDQAGQVYVIEANPNPDIHNDDEFALGAKRAGMTHQELLQRILRLALVWKPAA